MFLIRLFCSFGVGLLLMGCQNRVTWREEVQLSTGEVIVIDREVEHKGGGGPWPHGQGTVPQHHLISFEYPPNSGNIIRWRSTKFDMPRASWAEFPLVLDVDKNRNWYIYTIQGLDHGNCWRYIRYDYHQNAWTEVPLSDTFIDSHESNLYLAASSNSIDDYINLAIKGREYSQGGHFKFDLKVGPKQVVPRGDGLECHWIPATQSFKAINIKGEKQ